jgi:hypothetical protein
VDNFTPQLLYPHERRLIPIDLEVMWNTQPVWTLGKEKTHIEGA